MARAARGCTALFFTIALPLIIIVIIGSTVSVEHAHPVGVLRRDGPPTPLRAPATRQREAQKGAAGTQPEARQAESARVIRFCHATGHETYRVKG